MKATGYRTKHAGKGHLGTQKFIDTFNENVKGWDRWAPPINDDQDYLTYLRRLGVKPQKYTREVVGLQQDRKSPWASWGGWIEQSDGQPFPLEAQYSFYLARRAVEKLDAALLGNDGQTPIYLQLDIFDPHQPFSIPAGFEKREQELRKAVRLPDSYQRVRTNDWTRFPDEPKIYDFYRKNWGLYNERTAILYFRTSTEPPPPVTASFFSNAARTSASTSPAELDVVGRNLAASPDHRRKHKEMVQYLAAFLERDPHWRGYWHSFRLDRYHDLPRMDAVDVQMFKPI